MRPQWPTPDGYPPRVWAQRIFALDGDVEAQKALFNQLDEELQLWIRIHLKRAYLMRKHRTLMAQNRRAALLDRLR